MAVTVQRFKDNFDEFRKTDDALVLAKLTTAARRVAAGVWGGKTDDGIMYLTAHLVALAPAGQNAKIKPENAVKTVYWTTYKEMLREVTFGLRTAGLPAVGAFEDPANG